MIAGLIQSTIPQLLAAFGIVLPATSRAFLPAFLAALYLRSLAILGEGTQLATVAEVARAEAPWFTADVTIVILGLLALGEMALTKSPEAEAIVRQLDPLVKPAAAALTTFGILSATDAEIVHAMDAGLRMREASAMPWELLLALGSAALVFGAVWLRMELLELLDEMELDGVAKVFSWGEEVWVLLAMVLFALVPLVLLVLSAAILACVAVLEAWLERRARRLQRPCARCEAPRWPHGLACPRCGAEDPSPRAMSIFGLPKEAPADDPETQPGRLLAKGRCPRCAERLARGVVTQRCDACDHEVFGTEAAIEAFCERTGGRAEGAVLLICLGFGLIPVVGVIPAVLVYRRKLVAPYRRFLPRWQSLGLRWVARLGSFVLTLLQMVPFAGMLSLPAMAWLNHRLYRAAFRRAAHAERKATRRERPALAPDWLGSVGEKLRSRRARPVWVGAFALAALTVLGLSVWDVSAAAAPSCPGDRERLVGEWTERMTGFSLLRETFLEDGTYLLQGVDGRWRVVAPGRLELRAGPTTHTYEAWIDADALYYVADDGTLSTYAREGAPPAIPDGCVPRAEATRGAWTPAAGEGPRLVLGADGEVRRGDETGRWVAVGDAVAIEGAGFDAPTVGLVNDAERLLVVADGEPRVYERPR